MPEDAHINLNITANGYLEVNYYTDKDEIITLPKDKILQQFTTTKHVNGKYHMYRKGHLQNDPTSPLLCTIVNNSLYTANTDSGEIDSSPLFVD